jgi:uncharacterized membrane protein
MEKTDLFEIKQAMGALKQNYEQAQAALAAFESRDLPAENADLRQTASALGAQLSQSRDEITALQARYDELHRDFKHELTAKRSAALGISRQQHEAYMRTGLKQEYAKIDELYAAMNHAVTRLSASLRELDEQEKKPLAAELWQVETKIKEQMDQARIRKAKAWAEALHSHNDALDEIENAPLNDAALQAVRKFFNWEAFFGLKIISVLGVLSLLFGVLTFGRYLYVNMGEALQCAFIFLLGLALMAAGEALHRRKWRGSFTLALTAAGCGMLFLGAALGYMTLNVLPMAVALAACIAASLLSFGAAVRYRSQLVAALALVGGYLPLLGMSRDYLPYAVFYFALLNLLALLLSTRKLWRVVRFVGLFAGLTAEAVLLIYISDEATLSLAAALCVMLTVSFLTYLVVPVWDAWRGLAKIKASDVVLLVCNIVVKYVYLMWIAAVLSYYSFFSFISTEGAMAVVTAFFAVCCVVMAVVTHRQSNPPHTDLRPLGALFFITGATFAALVIPFALDTVWLFLGWLIQATGLLLYGILSKSPYRKRFCIAGAVIGGFCLMVFLLFNVPDYKSALFVWQYLSVTLAVLAVAAATLRSGVRSGGLDMLRGIAGFNAWVYIVYALHHFLPDAALAYLLSVTSGLALVFVSKGIQRLLPSCADEWQGFHAAGLLVGGCCVVGLLRFNALYTHGLTDGVTAVGVAVFALYIMVNLFAVLWVNALLHFLISLRRLSAAFYPLAASGFFVLLAVQNMVVQLSLGPSSLALTLVFGLAALGWIAHGFARQNRITRISGLSMAFFAVVKLFLLDLHGLDTAWRVVSYFVAGVVLLTISFTYQWYSKKMGKE